MLSVENGTQDGARGQKETTMAKIHSDWQEWMTGGNCRALGFNPHDGTDHHVMATRHEDPVVPEPGEAVFLGYYAPDDDQGIYLVATWDEFLARTPAEWLATVKVQGRYEHPAPHVDCENCVPDGQFGKCPRCYEATGHGCPHGDICNDCAERDREGGI